MQPTWLSSSVCLGVFMTLWWSHLLTVTGKLTHKSSALHSNSPLYLHTNHSLHAQSILTNRFPAVLVTAGFFLEEEALWEPQGAVLSLPTCDQHAYHQDHQQEQRGDAHQHQLAPLKSIRWDNDFLTLRKDREDTITQWPIKG